MNIKKPLEIIDHINTQVQRWDSFAKMANVDPLNIKKIQDTLLNFKTD